jgi:enoyl-CoA hydratase
MMRAVFPVSHMAYRNLALEVDAEGIATLTISRPEKLNALNADTLREIGDAVGGALSDTAVRGLIVTGAGEKAFVAGADIAELAAADALASIDIALAGQRLFRSLETGGKPSIAAINGFALGGGLELAMACTLRIASDNAKVGQPEVKLGIIAGYGGTQRLPRLVGRGRALELLLTGDMIDAAEAYRIGLVNRVVPLPDLIDTCRATMRRILAAGPVAVKLTMQAVDVGLNCGLEEGLRFEATAFGIAAATADRSEGTRAFLEKRPAKFIGK